MNGWRLHDIDSHEKTETRPVVIRSPVDERDCRSIVNKLVNSMPAEECTVEKNIRTSRTDQPSVC